MNNTDTAILVFDPIKSEIADLRSYNRGLQFDYELPADNKNARSHVAKLRKVKARIAKAHKTAKAEALEVCRVLDSYKRDLTQEVEEMIEVHAKPLRAIEERKERLRAEEEARIRAEKEAEERRNQEEIEAARRELEARQREIEAKEAAIRQKEEAIARKEREEKAAQEAKERAIEEERLAKEREAEQARIDAANAVKQLALDKAKFDAAKWNLAKIVNDILDHHVDPPANITAIIVDMLINGALSPYVTVDFELLGNS